MILNIIKDPITVWYKIEELKNSSKEPIPEITYGWDEFIEKSENEKLPLELLRNTNWNKDFKNFNNGGISFREEMTFGDYKILDGLISLNRKLKTLGEIDLSKYCINISSNQSIIFSQKEYDISEQELFFNAPKEYRDNILNGKQPLRNTAHYRLEAQKNKKSVSGDKTEGASDTKDVKSITNELRSGFIENVNINKLPFESHIFSMYDSKADKKTIASFGNDTYSITNNTEWIELIIEQVNSYWIKKRIDFIGTFVMFGKVHYKESKKNKELETFSELSNNLPLFSTADANYEVEGLNYIKYEIQNNVFDDCNKHHFRKPTNYSSESEHRLCILPLFSNQAGDGVITLDGNKDIIWMEIDDYYKAIELKNFA